MSDRLSDAELTALREHMRTERERNNGVPTLTWAEVDALLDEVQAIRRSVPQEVQDLSDEVFRLRQRIAELEEARDFWKERALESERGGGAREAQLAKLRRTVESWSDRGMVLVSDVISELDEADIPTAPPDAKEAHTRRIATLEWREASPPPPAVDPREEDDA